MFFRATVPARQTVPLRRLIGPACLARMLSLLLALLPAIPEGAARAQPRPGTAADAPADRVARVGVLAFRGVAPALEEWQPLMRYLSDQIAGWDFAVVPITLVSAPEKLRDKKIEFLATNPGHYVSLAREFDLSVLASREHLVGRDALSRFGSAVIVRSDAHLRSLSDLRGRTLAAVSPDAFGGFQLAWAEFRHHRIDPFADLESIRFMGFPMDAIVGAVRDGEVDAGVTRGGLLEGLVAEGKVAPEELTVLQAENQPDYPFRVTGALYPEWPFTALPGVDKTLRENVVRALLRTQDAQARAGYGLRDLWTAPLSYETVRRLIADYDAARARATAAPPDNGGGLPARTVPLALGLAAFVTAILALVLGQRRRRPAPTPAPTLAPAPTPAPAPVPGPGAPGRAGAATPDAARSTSEQAQRFDRLTAREREVLGLICSGESSKAIAAKLGISPKTVEYHRANLLQKTRANSSAQLVQMATRLGMG